MQIYIYYRLISPKPHYTRYVQTLLIIHKQNTKEIIAVKEPLYVIKHHVGLHRISRLHLVIYIENSFVTNWQGGYKIDRF